jgi:hypothetical protein
VRHILHMRIYLKEDGTRSVVVRAHPSFAAPVTGGLCGLVT